MPDGNASQVVARIEIRDQHLQRRIDVAVWRRDVRQMASNSASGSRQGSGDPCRGPEPARPEYREPICSSVVQVDEQVIDPFSTSRDGHPIDLVDDDDRRRSRSNASATRIVFPRASAASTSSTTPSTIDSTRSTSPPKSACPVY
jgi:hypothetical protein